MGAKRDRQLAKLQAQREIRRRVRDLLKISWKQWIDALNNELKWARRYHHERLDWEDERVLRIFEEKRTPLEERVNWQKEGF